MARIGMLRDFDWPVPGAKSKTFVALKSGLSYTVKRQCALDAIAAGAAVEERPPPRLRPENDDAGRSTS